MGVRAPFLCTQSSMRMRVNTLRKSETFRILEASQIKNIMTEQLKHFKRIHTTSEPFFYSFVLIGFDSKDNDSCVTLVRTNISRITAELRKWGTFTLYDIERIMKLKCGEQYYADKYSLVIRLS